MSLLTLLDLSAAFNTVDHTILLRQLQTTYDLEQDVLLWFKSYLTGRTQSVRCAESTSAILSVKFGLPQGSGLRPILFLLYMAEFVHLIESFPLRPHVFADDTQIYGSRHPSATGDLQHHVVLCIMAVAGRMMSNRLQLNTAKTEVM